MKKINFLTSIALISFLLFTASCEKDDKGDMKKVEDMTITGYALYDQNFSILADAVVKAGLAETLDGNGNFTVFSPTNDAFNDLFIQLGVSGIADLSAETLTPILLYHVVGEEVLSSMLSEGYYSSLSSSQGAYTSLLVNTTGGVKINNSADVILADVNVSNGVIHVINKVLLPPTVVDAAVANSSFSTLVEAVVKAGLAATLSGNGPFTIFAPTNQAFASLFSALGVSGIADLSAETLIPILQYHVVSGNVRSTDLVEGSVPTLNGNIQVTLGASPAINTDAKIIATDVQETNGVVHVIELIKCPEKTSGHFYCSYIVYVY
ncbi:MAG: fasciclin domain-containing protein [Bacteroidia bacterium]|nr:MAG: fasciclin domain-containing protein [Bacteroidia bacterium]